MAGVPVLVVNEKTKDLSKFLICTEGGEPGKVGITFGARIARHISPKVLLYHVLLNNTKKEEDRVKKYLEKSSAIFDAYNLRYESCIEKGNFSKNLLMKIEKENPSLVLLGAPLSNDGNFLDLMQSIIYKTDSSVFIVPSNN